MPFVSYAQNLEDVMLWRALKHVEKGFYIDIGAADADEHSVTRAFYERGWDGINVEPNQQYFATLTERRTRDINLQAVVGDATGNYPFFIIPETGLSTLCSDVASQHRAAGWPVQESRVAMLTLADICHQYASSIIHFLKIDVEGAEQRVLAGADFDLFRPWIVAVEATWPMSQIATHESWECLLTHAGYRYVWFDGLNRFYLAAERHSELQQYFHTPLNVFDDFTRFDAAKEALRARLDKERNARAALEIRLDEERNARAALEMRLDEEYDARAALEVLLRDERGHAQAQQQMLLARASAAESRLRQMQESTSWRMTALLRFAARGISSVWRIVNLTMFRNVARTYGRSAKE